MRVLFQETSLPFEGFSCLWARIRVVRTNKREQLFDDTAAVGAASAVVAAGFAGTAPVAVVVRICVTGARTRPSRPHGHAFQVASVDALT